MNNSLPSTVYQGVIEFPEDIALIKSDPILSTYTDTAINVLWSVFSEINWASFLVVDTESIERFKEWLLSGDPDDART